MKHACPQCGKKFDYEKEGWICPFCGSVVLASTEQKMYQEEQLKREQKKESQAFPNQTYRMPQRTPMLTSIRNKLLSMVLSLLLIPVILLGVSIGISFPKLQRQMEVQKQQIEAGVSYVTEQAEMKKTLPVPPYTLCIQQAYLYPTALAAPPKNGQYLAVSYSNAGKNAKSSIQRIKDVAWAALRDDTTGSYLLPLYISDISGSETVQQALREQGIDQEFQSESGILLFLLPDTTDLDTLTLCVFAGTESENNHTYGRDAVDIEQMYEIPLTVTEAPEGTAA